MGGFRCGGALRRGRGNSGERLRARGWLSSWLSVRRGLPRRMRARRWSWRGEWLTGTAGGERRSSASNGAMALTTAAALASGEGEGVGRGHNGASGGAGWRPDRVKPVAGRPRPRRRHTAATWSAPGGARRARPHVGEGRGSWAARLSRPKGRRVGPAAPAPFFFFF